MSAVDDESKRQRKKGETIDLINRLFGIESFEGAPTVMPEPQMSPGAAAGRRATGSAVANAENKRLANEYARQITEWEKQQAAYDLYVSQNTDQETTTENYNALEDLYGGVRGDVFNTLTNDLTEQKTTADRQSKFWLAQRGVTGGSSDIDTKADILGNFNDAVIDVDNRADNAEDSFRGADTESRLNIIDLINDGLSSESAQQRSSNSLSQNLQDAKKNALYQGIGNIFSGYGAYQRNQNQNQNRNQNRNRGGGGYGDTYFANA